MESFDFFNEKTAKKILKRNRPNAHITGFAKKEFDDYAFLCLTPNGYRVYRVYMDGFVM